MYTSASFQAMLPLAFVFKDGPALQYIYHLQVHFVVMPLPSCVRTRPRLDDVHDRSAFGGLVDAQIPVLKIRPHAVVRKGFIVGMLNSAPARMPVGQRAVMVFSRV